MAQHHSRHARKQPDKKTNRLLKLLLSLLAGLSIAIAIAWSSGWFTVRPQSLKPLNEILARTLAQGIAAAERQQWDQAAQHLDEVLKEIPEHPQANLFRGQIWYQQGKWEQALACFQVVPDQPMQTGAPARFAEGVLLIEQGKVQAGERQLRRAVQLNPRYLQAHERLLQLDALLMRPAAIRSELEAIRYLRPWSLEELVLYTVAGERIEQADAAIPRLERFIAKQPEDPTYPTLLARYLVDAGRTEEAEARLLAWSEQHAPDAAMLGLQADLRLQAGDLQSAAHLLAALPPPSKTDASPAIDARYWKACGKFWMEHKQWEFAADCYAAAVQRNDEDLGATHQLGVLLARLERKEAAFYLRRAEQLDRLLREAARIPQRTRQEPRLLAEILLHAADALTQLERHQEAVLWYDQVLLLQPDSTLARTKMQASLDAWRAQTARHDRTTRDGTGSHEPRINVAAQTRMYDPPSTPIETWLTRLGETIARQESPATPTPHAVASAARVPPAPRSPASTSLGKETQPAPDSTSSSAQSPARVSTQQTEITVPTPSSPGTIRLRDVHRETGVDFQYFNGQTPFKFLLESMGGGVAVLDYDQDGWQDLYLIQGGELDTVRGVSADISTARPDGDQKRLHDDSLQANRVSSGPATNASQDQTPAAVPTPARMPVGVLQANTSGMSLANSQAAARIENRLYRNLGNGQFRDVTREAGLGDVGYGQGVTVGDYDNDGDPDLFIANFGRNSLYQNHGDGTFIDVTVAAGLTSAEWSSSVAFADLDRDGALDLYVVNYVDSLRICRGDNGRIATCDPSNFQGAQDRLYQNRGDGTFADVTQDAGIIAANGKGLGLVVVDLDGDLREEIYVANDGTPNFLFRNESTPGQLKFVEIGALAGVAVNRHGQAEGGMGIACSDFDGDGKLDLYVTNFSAETNTFYRNLGDLFFEDATDRLPVSAVTRELVGFGVQPIDFDLDGQSDLLVTNGHIDDFRFRGEPWKMRPLLLKNEGLDRWSDQSVQAGPYFAGEYLGRGLARWDWDADGDPDAVIVHQDAPVAILSNESPVVGNWLKLEFRGRSVAREALGTRVEIQLQDRVQREQLLGGDGFYSSNQRCLHIGLGSAEEVERLIVTWPDGQQATYEQLPVNQHLRLIQGSAPLRITVSPASSH